MASDGVECLRAKDCVQDVVRTHRQGGIHGVVAQTQRLLTDVAQPLLKKRD